jgi:hypothetical protein
MMARSSPIVEENSPKKPWIKPELRRLEITPELLALFRDRGPMRAVVYSIEDRKQD